MNLQGNGSVAFIATSIFEGVKKLASLVNGNCFNLPIKHDQIIYL